MHMQDVTMIVRHVLTVLLDPNTKQQLQLAALQTALHFSPDAIADRFATITFTPAGSSVCLTLSTPPTSGACNLLGQYQKVAKSKHRCFATHFTSL